MKILVPLALALLLVAQAAPAQLVTLPDTVASSGNDGVGGIERQPPGAGNLGKPGKPNSPSSTAPTLAPPTRNDPPPQDATAARDLGRELPGRHGAPRLGVLPIADGALALLVLDGLAPGAEVTLVAGGALVDVPTRGGTLAPAPELTLTLRADARGRVVLGLPWPASALVLQAWAVDASGPEGFTASNALLIGG